MNRYDLFVAGVPVAFPRLIPAFFSLLLVAALAMRLGFPLILIVPLTLMLMGALLVPWRQVRAVMAGVLGFLALVWGTRKFDPTHPKA